MKKYIVEDVRVGISVGGIACGPVPGHVIGEVKLRNSTGNIIYYCLTEVEGTLNFYESEESTFEGQINEDFDNDVFNELMDNSYSCGYCSYEEFYEELNDNLPLNNSSLILKYLAYIVRASWEEIDIFKKATIGNYIGEFDIPLCDMENEYLNEQNLDHK